MNNVLAQWNALDPDDAARKVLPSNGSRAWAAALAARRPFADVDSLFAAANEVWLSLPQAAWQEAFDSHPRIGQRHAQSQATEQSLQWSAQEQRAALSDGDADRLTLQDANELYERKFGRIFLICASGKSVAEILTALDRRMENDAATELREAVEQQRQITQLRLRRWLESS